MPTDHLRLFPANASILLLGFEGAGRKTLGIIASIADKRQFVEFGRFFSKSTGHSLREYVALYGVNRSHEEVSKIIENILDKHSLNSVITGIPQSCIRSQKDALKSFARTNPVIYVRRSKVELELFSKNEKVKAERVYEVLDKFYKSCSNIDYYNLSQGSNNGLTAANATLKLKAVETDFVRFIQRIFGHLPNQSFPKDPIADSHSYALQVPLKWLEATTDPIQLECGADVINLVVSASEKRQDLQEHLSRQVAFIRRKTKVPVILDIKTCEDSSTYLSMLSSGLRVLPEAVKVDLAIEDGLIQTVNLVKGFAKTMGTYHHKGSWRDLQNLDVLPKLLMKAAQLSLNALEISTESTAREDSMECLEFVHSMKRIFKIPLIAYSTGDLGRTTICFNKTLSPVVLPSLSETGVTIVQARTALYSAFVLEPLRFYAFGSNVSYSLSPAMHNAAYKVCGLQHVYGFHQSDNFEDIQVLLQNQDSGGVAISMPYKTQVLRLLDVVSLEAQQIGAVNTIVVERQYGTDGSVKKTFRGFNTDHIGVRECVLQHLSPANKIHAGSTALILGAGGMARATIYAFQKMGLKNICIYNRTLDNADKLTQQYSSPECTLHVLSSLDMDWPTSLEPPTIIVSTIPGSRANDTPSHTLNIPETWLKSGSGGTFIELAYKPLVTRLIKQMRQMSANGWIVVDGLSVLLEQGIAQFELFTGSPAPVSVMREALKHQFASASAADFSSGSDESVECLGVRIFPCSGYVLSLRGLLRKNIRW